MKTLLIATATVLSLSAGVANAESEGGPAANTQFTNNPSSGAGAGAGFHPWRRRRAARRCSGG